MCRYVCWAMIVCFTGPMSIALADGPNVTDAEAYVKKIEATQQRLIAAGGEFGKTLGPAISGGAVEQLAANKQYRQAAKL